ncbi:hypothetical protein [Saccharopolyspora mangrovi]|uniref:Uncharacterized protein n=1 Tax=Saccharopolyspora mangrovi TaxID=3082379 RepID=A0ABU6AJA7_9PSEU|nr:hypothetical protein [Saccharopolyspora sp. S2-29]MEB3371601.1 hypothetical protein [Saccharopolyspora sp. S2-29]
MEIAGPHIALVSGTSSLGSACVLPVPADTYVLQAHCRGRAEAEAAFLAWLDAEGDEAELCPHDGIERWLIRFWPRQNQR